MKPSRNKDTTNASAAKRLAASSAFATGLSFLSWPTISRLSGPEVVGQYNYYLTLVAISGPILTLMRERIICTSNSTRERIIETSFFYKHLPASLCVCIASIFIYQLASTTSPATSYPILAIIISSNAILLIYKSIATSLKRYTILAITNSSQPAFFIICYVCIDLIAKKPSAYTLLTSYLASLIATVAFIHFKGKLPKSHLFHTKKLNKSRKSPHTKDLFRYVAPACFIDVLTANLPFILLISKIGSAQAAYYALILRLFSMPLNTISRATQPIILRHFSDNLAQAHKINKSNLLLLALVALSTVYATVVILSLEYAWPILGSEWEYNQSAILYIGFIACLQFISSQYSILLISIRRLKLASLMQVLNLAATISIFLIFRFKNLSEFLIILASKEIIFRAAYLTSTKIATKRTWTY